MNKKAYTKPACEVVYIKTQPCMLSASELTSSGLNSNEDLKVGDNSEAEGDDMWEDAW